MGTDSGIWLGSDSLSAACPVTQDASRQAAAIIGLPPKIVIGYIPRSANAGGVCPHGRNVSFENRRILF